MWLHQYINITTFNYSTWQSFLYVAWLMNIHDVNHQKRHTQETYKRALHSSTETCTQRITKEWHKRALHSQKSPTFTNRVTKDVKHLHRRAFVNVSRLCKCLIRRQTFTNENIYKCKHLQRRLQMQTFTKTSNIFFPPSNIYKWNGEHFRRLYARGKKNDWTPSACTVL